MPELEVKQITDMGHKISKETRHVEIEVGWTLPAPGVLHELRVGKGQGHVIWRLSESPF